jgi:hypothetical protein
MFVQNTSDGKLVEQEAGGGEEGKQRSVGGLHVDNEEKMDSLQLEYTYLLTSQVHKIPFCTVPNIDCFIQTNIILPVAVRNVDL